MHVVPHALDTLRGKSKVLAGVYRGAVYALKALCVGSDWIREPCARWI